MKWHTTEDAFSDLYAFGFGGVFYEVAQVTDYQDFPRHGPHRAAVLLIDGCPDIVFHKVEDAQRWADESDEETRHAAQTARSVQR